jgi:hypothetical protein
LRFDGTRFAGCFGGTSQPIIHAAAKFAPPEEGQMTSLRFLLGLAFLLPLISSGSARAEVPRKPPPPGDTLQAVLDSIHNHAAGEAWKEPGWKDAAIEAWLDKLVGSVAKAADYPDLKLPMRFANVKAGDQPMGRTLSGALLVGKDIDLKTTSLRNCIILADGNVDISGADNCVIVSRGTVAVHSISQLSVIVAGTLVKLQLDGRPNNDAGSLVVSRGWVDMGRSSYGTMVAAHEGVHAGRFQGTIFINMPVPPARLDPRGANASRSLSVNDLPLERLPVHALSEKITLLGVLHGKLEQPAGFGGVALAGRLVSGPMGIVFRFESRKYVAELGQPIVDESGKPVEALRHWKLTQVAGKVAVLSGAEADAVVHIVGN